MNAVTQGWGSGARLWLLLLWAILPAATAVAQPSALEAMVNAKARDFFDGKLAPTDFSVASPWRRNFESSNLANRAQLAIESVNILEVRLPTGASGLEGLYSIKARLANPAFVGSDRLEPGVYWLSGNMTFVSTTRGWLVRDASFVVLDEGGRVKGTNFLPWQTGMRIGSR